MHQNKKTPRKAESSSSASEEEALTKKMNEKMVSFREEDSFDPKRGDQAVQEL